VAEHPDRFFIPGVSTRDEVEPEPAEARHMVRVLRMRPGDELTAFDGTGVECRCRIASVSGRHMRVEVLERHAIRREANVAVTLAVAASKNRAMDMIVQKCTELGAARLAAFHAGRSVARLEQPKAEKWRRVAIEAAKQCGRNMLPRIDEPLGPEGLPPLIREHATALVAAESGPAFTLKQALQRHPLPGAVLCIIGPEGGFEAAELAALAAAGAVPVSLGRSILRVETAAIAALAMIIYHFSD